MIFKKITLFKTYFFDLTRKDFNQSQHIEPNFFLIQLR